MPYRNCGTSLRNDRSPLITGTAGTNRADIAEQVLLVEAFMPAQGNPGIQPSAGTSSGITGSKDRHSFS